jgi:serine/threonine protein kinase
MPLPEDTILEERYRIDKLLAYGGMGAVYRAYDTNLQIEVAIKENYFRTPQAVEQFKREALMLARLRHPGLPRVLQHFTWEGQQYLVMEFIEGPNLWEMVKQRGGPFDEAQAMVWIDRVCSAVAYLHGQSPPIIHRDIKPQNVKVMTNNQVVLVDFGIAKEGDASARTATGARGVTPGFSPPEQYSGGGSSPVSDVYALGATLYALLTGVKPPDSVSLAIGEVEYVPPDKLNPAVNPEVARAITWAMQPRPADRPQTVETWLQKLREISTQPAPQEQRGAAVPKPSPPASPPTPAVTPTKLEATCHTCGAQNRAGVRFCEQCGASLETASPTPPSPTAGPTCHACGVRNRAGIRFCEECGASLETAPPTPPSPTTGPTCHACSAQNRAGIRFCERCGASLETAPPTSASTPARPICSICSTQNRVGAHFCRECRSPLT